MRERVALVGSLAATLTEPSREGVNRPAVVLLNAGLVPRQGPNRLHVRLGRALAARGYPVLRFDFSGVGDSPARADGLPRVRSVVLETRQAMTWLQEDLGVEHFVLVGLCGGGTAALGSALQDSRVVGTILINVRPGLSGFVERWQARVGKLVRTYWRVLLFKPWTVRRALRGAGSLEPASANPAVARFDETELRTLLNRGVRVLFVFSEGDVGFDRLRVRVGPVLDEMLDGRSAWLELVPRADHVFTTLESQRALVARVEHWLDQFQSANLARA